MTRSRAVPQRSRDPGAAKLVVHALALALLALPACAPDDKPAEKAFPHAILTPEPRKAVPAVPLVTGDGKPAPKDLLAGRWTWLYFGFTHCPDVCPRAMEYAASEYGKLKRPQDVRVVFVSVDPARDRVPRLEQFVDFYHKDFVGVTGEKADLDTLAKAVGATYVIEKPTAPGGGYNVSHTNLVFVLDPDGRWAATYVPDAQPGAMAADFDRLTAKEPS